MSSKAPKSVPKHSSGKSKPKISKQPLPPSERLKRHFKSLCAQIDGGHFPNAIKTCDKILRIDPQDQDAIQTKLFLLLQTDQYASALALIDSHENFVFEKSYSLYRLHREDEVEEVLGTLKESQGEDDRGVIHLDAQLHYRQGSYQSAFDLYNELLDNTEPDTEEHSDVLTNLEAAQKHLDFVNSEYLHVLDELPNSITTTLETLPPPALPQISSVLASISANTGVEQKSSGESGLKKKVRARRVPKGVVPGVTPPPDPERWLKKSERSTFHTGHKKKRGGGGATQGIVESAPAPVAASGGGGKSKSRKRK